MIWMLTRKDTKEILTVPTLLRGERIKRLVGVKTGIPVTVGTITKTSRNIDSVIKIMMRLYKQESMAYFKGFAMVTMLLEAINNPGLVDEIFNRTNTTSIERIDIKPTFEGNSISFSFPNIKQLVKNRNKKYSKTIHTESGKIIIGKTIVLSSPLYIPNNLQNLYK